MMRIRLRYQLLRLPLHLPLKFRLVMVSSECTADLIWLLLLRPVTTIRSLCYACWLPFGVNVNDDAL